jgi:hypothetical protein
MRGKILKTLIGIAVILAAWTVGHAQGQAAATNQYLIPVETDQYLILIDAPGGKTTLTCSKGCNWKTGWFSCGADRCAYGFNQDGSASRFSGPQPK